MAAVDHGIAIRAHYERFPATIKGAFVLRGEGRDPHQVRIEEARVAEAAGRGFQVIGIEPVMLEVAPHLDLFVPFEFSVAELEAGWYQLECDVFIDGVADLVRPGDRFPVAWPRASVRRGAVPVAAEVDTPAGSVTFDQIDCGADSIKIAFSTSTPPFLKLSADGSPIPVLDVTFDEDTGRGRIVAYPLSKTARTLSIELKGAEPLEVPLG
jgi:hypothetical protein